MRTLLLFFPILIGIGTESVEFTLLEQGSAAETKHFPLDTAKPLEIELGLRSSSYSGQILNIQGTDLTTGAKQFALAAVVRQRFLNVQLTGSADQIMGHVQNIPIDITEPPEDSEYHQLRIVLNLSAKALSVSLDGKEERVVISESASDLQTELKIYIGSTGFNSAKSVIGCVSDFSISVGSTQLDDMIEAYSGTVNGCKDGCQTNPCVVVEACVNRYSTSFCDCSTTQKEGPMCDKDESVVSLDGSQQIEFKPNEDEPGAKQPKRILLTFRTTTINPQTLISGAFDEEEWYVLIGETSAHLKIASLDNHASLNGLPLTNGEWHTMSLKYDYATSTIIFQIDNVSNNLVLPKEIEDLPLGSFPTITKLFFGGLYQGQNGFNGCLKNVYVGHINVLPQLRDEGSSSVAFSGGKVRFECSVTPIIGTVIEDENVNPDIPDINIKAPEESEFEEVASQVPTIVPIPDPTTNENTKEGSDGGWVGPVQQSCDEITCRHDTECFVNAETGEARCDCENSGYSGRFCQFSTLPKNCEEVAHLSDRKNGVYLLDLDGEGRLKPTYVYCVFDGPTAETQITHNFPNETALRAGSAYEDSTLRIQYRMVSEEQLRYVVQNAQFCHQYVAYSCRKAPLKFLERTWFTSQGSEEWFGQIGKRAGQCPCAESGTCVGVVAPYGCNCDSNQDVERLDEGYVEGTLAGITSVTVLQEQNQDWGRLTLGPVQCYGTKDQETSVTFRSADSRLETLNWAGKSMSFWFRTSDNEGVFVNQEGDGKSINLKLIAGHIVQLSYRLAENLKTLRVVSTKPLSDSKWHKVQLRVADQEIELAADGTQAYATLNGEENAVFSGKLLVGDDNTNNRGFVGCIRQFEMDGQSQDLRNYIGSQHGVESGCVDSCASSPCMNNAECVEDFAAATYRCVCANPWAHSGKNCENDVNQGTEISFRDRANSFLKFRDPPANPITSSLLFSFRTDQSSALLAYAFDQYYNFVEVHLSDDNHISLTLNYNRTVRRCTIESRQEFSNMEWNQVFVNYTNEFTILNVDDLMCVIDEKRNMAGSLIESWEFGNDLVNVEPPRPPVPPPDPVNITPFSLLYIGGLTKPSMRRRKRSYYITRLPNLLGCARGIKIGQHNLDPNQGSKTGRVERGCVFGCADLGCQNGAHCNVPWTDSLASPTCDCTYTSYIGPTCSSDNGLHFEGTSTLYFHAYRIFDRLKLPERRLPPSFRFSFSSASDSTHSRQTLTQLEFQSGVTLRIRVNSSEGLSFTVTDKRRTVDNELIINGNYSNGERHFVFIKFRPDDLYMKVDGVPHRLLLDQQRNFLDLSELDTLMLGGLPEGKNLPEEGQSNYIGCLSNVVIDFRDENRKHIFTPIQYFTDAASEYPDVVELHPSSASAIPTACAGESTVGAPTSPPPTYPPWHPPSIEREKYVAPKEEKKGGGGGNMGVAIALIVILVVVVVGVGGYVYYVKCIRGKRDSADVTKVDGGSTYSRGHTHDSPPPEKPHRMTPPDPSSIPEETVPLRSPTSSPYSHNGSERPSMYGNAPGIEKLPTNPDLPDTTENLDERDSVHPSSSLWIPAGGSSSSGINEAEVVRSESPPAQAVILRHRTDEEFPPPPSEEELRDSITVEELPYSPNSPFLRRTSPGTFRSSKQKDFEGGDEAPLNLVHEPRPASANLVRRTSSRKQPLYVPTPKI